MQVMQMVDGLSKAVNASMMLFHCSHGLQSSRK